MTRRPTKPLLAAIVVAMIMGFAIADPARAGSPISRVEIRDLPVAAAADILTSSITCRDSGWPSTTMHVTIGVVTTDSVFSCEVTPATGTAYVWAFNSGVALQAGCTYTFSRSMSASCTYNFQLETLTTVGELDVQEIQDGGQ